MAGEGDVGDTGEVLRDDTAISFGEGGKDGASRGTAVGEGAVGGTGYLLGEPDVAVDGDSTSIGRLREAEGGEGREDEVGSVGTGFNERASKREDGLGTQGSVESTGSSSNTREEADQGLMPALNRKYGTSSAENAGIGKKRSGSEIGRDANLLKDGGDANHFLGRGKAKVVLARLYGLETGLSNGRLKQSDVSGFRGTNILEISKLDLVEP